MIDQFTWQLNCVAMMSNIVNTCQEDSSEKKQKSIITPSTSKESVINPLEKEAKILSDKYGELSKDKVLEIDLNTACSLLGKTRHRVDAFNRLGKYLKDNYQVTLKITSRKTH